MSPDTVAAASFQKLLVEHMQPNSSSEDMDASQVCETETIASSDADMPDAGTAIVQ